MLCQSPTVDDDVETWIASLLNNGDAVHTTTQNSAQRLS
jgi:hypothetical protein